MFMYKMKGGCMMGKAFINNRYYYCYYAYPRMYNAPGLFAVSLK